MWRNLQISNWLKIVLFLVIVQSTHGYYKGRYTQNVKHFKVVIPTKVSKEGTFVSYYLPHFYNIERVKRGIETGKVRYAIEIEGEERVLELQPTEDFHAPGMVIEHHEIDARNNVNTVKLRKPRDRKCYYHGWVKDEPSSSVAISACSGIAGAIKIRADQYLIEPIDNEANPTIDEKHRHIIYKRTDHNEINNQSTCRTTESFVNAFKQRMEWENNYKHNIEPNERTEAPIIPSLNFNETNLHRQHRSCTSCKPKLITNCVTPKAPCQIDRPLYIELLVVIGPRVATMKFIDDDIEQYINTIVNIAVRHFQDSSLGRPLLIKLVRVITLGYVYENLDARRYKPQELLIQFCDWQLRFNPKLDEHPNHHDFAIYLVKFEYCQGQTHGLAHMASMCRPDKACAVVNEEGLLTGHIITHMLGHGLGADHDDVSLGGCYPKEPYGIQYHMGSHIDSRSSAWSVCSKQCINKFVNSAAGWCLTDVPTSTELTFPTLLPGQVYTAAEQCRINFEMDTYACLVGEFCKRLYCKLNDKECISTGEPPAQGTRCGPDMWCFNERCVYRGSRPGSVNGEWGLWSQWTPCTKTCGGGVQTAFRACDSPAPSQDGRLCSGPRIKNRMCNVGGCADSGKGFLDQQCRNTNNRPYHGKKHEWVFFNQQIQDMDCVVICINQDGDVAVRNPLARDGTFCKAGSKDVCVRGACQPVGCDWVIGSKSKEDACGTCHGNGTECRIIRGFFNDRNFKGVIQFLKLPVGTSMILVRETRPSPCYFSITNSMNSSNYLNNNQVNRDFFSGTFSIQGIIAVYQIKADMERLYIKEPLRVPITISLECHESENSMGILYQYALPEPLSQSSKAAFTWEFLSWDKCPNSCGGGIQRAVPVCVESQGGEVEDCFCKLETRPTDRIRVCNPRPCDARWWVGPWSECDCYLKEGITTRMVMCAHQKEARSNYITIVPEQECRNDPKPRSEKSCDVDKDNQYWLKKENTKKRELSEVIPYNNLTEDYSVWDNLSGDISPLVVNVAKYFNSLDPENIADYSYLKRLGITIKEWDKMQNNRKCTMRRKRLGQLNLAKTLYSTQY